MCSKRIIKGDVELLELKTVPNGMGGVKKEWVQTGTFKGFLDTPSTDEQLKYHHRNQTLDRMLYYTFGAAMIPAGARINYKHPKTGATELYEVIGKPSDQGGQGRYMQLALKAVV